MKSLNVSQNRAIRFYPKMADMMVIGYYAGLRPSTGSVTDYFTSGAYSELFHCRWA